jgi:superoxide dismutase, Cu-Zn family
MRFNNVGTKAAIVCTALLVVLGNACGDDDDDGGKGGQGGSAGQAGSGGKGGTGGVAGSSGSGGSSGSAGTSSDSGVVDSQSDAAAESANATLAARSGSSLAGSAVFTSAGNKVTLTLTVEGAGAAGKRGVHIHQNGSCGSADGGATEAGGHWNPADASHGSPDAASHHLGDVGNIEIGGDGKGTLTLTTDMWSIGTGAENDVVGHAIVVHQIEDIQTPDAALGARIGCGVIAKSGANQGG